SRARGQRAARLRPDARACARTTRRGPRRVDVASSPPFGELRFRDVLEGLDTAAPTDVPGTDGAGAGDRRRRIRPQARSAAQWAGHEPGFGSGRLRAASIAAS